MATVPARICSDAALKDAESDLMETCGLDLSAAVNLSKSECLFRGDLPFDVNDASLRPGTVQALEEAEHLLNDPQTQTYEVHALMRELHNPA